MSEFDSRNSVHLVQALNEQRGCPETIDKATTMGTCPVGEMSADGRKSEYYYLLDGVLAEVVGNVRDFRKQFPEGLVERNANGELVSALPSMLSRVQPYVANGDFVGASYWVHDAMYKTIDLATEKWLAETDTTSPVYQRINSLVDDPRQAQFGNVAVQKRVSSAANQTVHISCSMQRMTHDLFPGANDGQQISPAKMRAAHDTNLRFAMPMTGLHLLETRPLRTVLGSETLPGGKVEMYANREYFAFGDDGLQPNGAQMIEAMAQYPGTFPDGRIGCPGLKYVPEIWAWAGDLSEAYAMPALAPSEYEFSVPSTIPR